MIVFSISSRAVYAVLRTRFARGRWDGFAIITVPFLSDSRRSKRSGILIAIMMADPVHKRAVAPASSFRALSQSSRDTIWGRSMLLELSTLLMIRLLWFQPPSSGFSH